jgi:DNA-binding MarR family transcriptional regulator
MATTLAPLAPGTLTEKQHEVYELIRKADGVIDNKAIATELGTTTNNVAQHVRKMRQRGVLPEAAARVDAQAAQFIAAAKDRLTTIEASIAAIDRQREQLATAGKHLEAQIRGLGAAIDESNGS